MAINPSQTEFFYPDTDLETDDAISDIKETPIYDLNLANELFALLKENNFGSSLSMLNLNIRSITKNINELKLLLYKMNWSFNIICLQETWCKPDLPHETLELEGYTLQSQPRRDGKQGGGLGIYIQNDLVFKNRNELSVTCVDLELMAIEIIRPKEKNIIIANIYRPPSGKVDQLHDILSATLTNISREGKPIYILGDFNMNLLDYDTEPKVHNFLNIMYENLLVPAINKPTRITKNTATCIDNIFFPINFRSKHHSGIVTENISDHLPQFLVVTSLPLITAKQRLIVEKRIITPLKLSTMKTKLSNISWNVVTFKTDVDEAYSAFTDEFEFLYNDLFPVTKVTVKGKTILNKWMNKELIVMSRKKQKLYNKYLKNKTYANELNYKNYKKCFEKQKKLTKKAYYTRLLQQHQSNLRMSWNVMKEIIGNSKANGHNHPSYLSLNGREILSQKEMAGMFNWYFSSVGANLAKDIPTSTRSFKDYMQIFDNNFSFGEISDSEIIDAVQSLKLHKSAGYDEFLTDVIKDVAYEILLPLNNIFNKSVQQCLFPQYMKVAKVIPIFKADDPSDVRNYRPISILSVFSKIFEKVIYAKLYLYLEENLILYEKQFGFRKNTSTELALVELVDKVTSAMDKKQYTLGVFLDLAKAFDTVDHNILLSKLTYYGLSGSSVAWFKSYLSGRSQYVDLKKATSELLPVTCGVPQGSVLGPLLFLIYVNDISNAICNIQLLLFADDTNLFFSHSCISTCFSVMNAELKLVEDWLHANRLSLSLKKTKYIVFGKERKIDALPLVLPKLMIGQGTIKRTSSTPFLGVIIDENLTWNDHIRLVETKIARNIGAIAKARKYLTRTAARSLYFSFVHPYISYGNMVWASTYKSKLSKIFTLQKRAVRIISYANRLTHSRPLMVQQKLLNVYELNIYKTLTFVFRHRHNLLPNVFAPYLKQIEHRYKSRMSKLGYVEKRLTGKSRFSISCRGPYLWNRINCSTAKENSNMNNFKSELKTFLLQSTSATSIW